VKKLIIIILLLTSNAYADSATARLSTEKSVQVRKKKIKMNLSINFPWGICRTTYTSYVRYPKVITGTACGVRVSCYRTQGTKYICYY